MLPLYSLGQVQSKKVRFRGSHHGICHCPGCIFFFPAGPIWWDELDKALAVAKEGKKKRRTKAEVANPCSAWRGHSNDHWPNTLACGRPPRTHCAGCWFGQPMGSLSCSPWAKLATPHPWTAASGGGWVGLVGMFRRFLNMTPRLHPPPPGWPTSVWIDTSQQVTSLGHISPTHAHLLEWNVKMDCKKRFVCPPQKCASQNNLQGWRVTGSAQ